MEDLQIIGGKFFTKPAEPVEVPREVVVARLESARAALADAEQDEITFLEENGQTKALWSNQVDSIEAWLAQVPEDPE